MESQQVWVRTIDGDVIAVDQIVRYKAATGTATGRTVVEAFTNDGLSAVHLGPFVSPHQALGFCRRHFGPVIDPADLNVAEQGRPSGSCDAAEPSTNQPTNKENIMSEAAKVITVDGVEYRHVAAPSEVRIVVLQRGWIVVGRWAQDGDEVVVRDASVVRFWGTTRGLGELFDGPTKTTKLDPAGTVRANAAAVVLTIDVDAEAWAEHL
jgi:hypothetical protein